MKRILLTSTALVAFAGAAAAEVSFNGDAEIGYNDTVENGFYWSMGLTVKASQELNGGLTAGFSLDVDLDDDRGTSTFEQDAIETSDFELYLKSDNAGLYFGDTKTTTQKYWEDVRGMQGFFLERKAASSEATLRGEATLGSAFVSVSALVKDTNGGTDDADVGAYQGLVKYDFGTFSVIAAYQGEDTNFGLSDDAFGLTGMATFAGAKVTLSYATMGDADAFGIAASYPVGPVTVGAAYAANDTGAGDYDAYSLYAEYKQGDIWAKAYYDGGESAVNTDRSIFGVRGSYTMSDLKLFAAVEVNDEADTTAYVIGGEYDLGGGASLLFSHGDDDVAGNANDDVADWNDDYDDYNEGTTVALSFKF